MLDALLLLVFLNEWHSNSIIENNRNIIEIIVYYSLLLKLLLQIGT